MEICCSGGIAGKTAFEAARPFYNAYQIRRAYDRLQKDPFQGSGRDVIARMKNHNGETVMLQRGEVLKKDDGSIIASGKIWAELPEPKGIMV